MLAPVSLQFLSRDECRASGGHVSSPSGNRPELAGGTLQTVASGLYYVVYVNYTQLSWTNLLLLQLAEYL